MIKTTTKDLVNITHIIQRMFEGVNFIHGKEKDQDKIEIKRLQKSHNVLATAQSTQV